MRHSLRAVLLAFSSFVSSPAYAEEEIVVTATRAPTQSERLPARIDVIDRADIEASGLATLTDAVGAQAVQSGGAGQQTSVFLRGASSSHVLALFDGVRLNDASNPSGQYDFGQDALAALSRVEVLRGPASAIYGSDAIGGVVNLIPRRGGDNAFEPFLEAAVGSLDTHNTVLGAAGAVGGLEYGVGADAYESNGYDLIPARMTTHTGDPDGARISSATMSARLNTGEFAFDALARVRSTEASYDTFSGGPFLDLRADDPDLVNDADQSLWRLGAEHAGALTLRFAGGEVRSDRTETDGGIMANGALSMRTFAEATARADTDDGTATFGLSYERNAIETSPQFANPLSAAETHRSAFVVAQFEMAQRTSATASLRADDYAGFGVQETYAGGLVFRLARLRLFGATGTGFRAPSLSERFEVSMFNVGNPDLRPERSRSWEIGADWSVRDGLRLGGTLYRTRIEDLIEYDFAQLKNINIGQADIDGAELRAEAEAASWATLRLAFDWIDARNGETGARLPRRPNHSWTIDARISPTNRLAIALSWRSVGERTDVTYDDGGAFLSSSGSIRGFGVGAASLTFDLDTNAQIFVRVDNVTDEVYEQPAAFAGAPRTASAGIRARL